MISDIDRNHCCTTTENPCNPSFSRGQSHYILILFKYRWKDREGKFTSISLVNPEFKPTGMLLPLEQFETDRNFCG